MGADHESSCTTLFGLGVLALLGVASASHADDPPPTLSEIRDRYTASLASLESLEVTYDFQQEAAVAAVFEEDSLAVPGPLPPIRMRVLRQSGRWRSDTTVLNADGGAVSSIAVSSFDGTRVYVAQSGGGDGHAIERVGIRTPTPEHPLQEPSTQIETLLGIELIGFNTTTHSLAVLLDASVGGEVVRDDVAGHPCWRVQVGGEGELDGTAYEVAAWFDPAAGWLVRKLEGRVWDATRGRDNTLPGGELSFSLFVDGFVPVAGAPADVWFPESAVLAGKYATTRFRVHSVRSGEALALTDFVPEIPVGAEVIETFPDGSHRTYHYGVRTDVDAMVRNSAAAIRAAAAQPPTATMPTESVVTARATRGLSWVWLFVVAGIAAAVAAVYLKRRAA